MIMVVIGVFLLASAFATVGYVAGYALARAQGEARLIEALADYPGRPVAEVAAEMDMMELYHRDPDAFRRNLEQWR